MSELAIPARLGARWGEGEEADAMAELLARFPGKPVAIDEASRKLNLPPGGVKAAIRQLSREGYGITGPTRSGYRLRRIPDIPLPRIVRDGLRAKVVGREVFGFRRAGSTNDIGHHLAAHGCPNGSVVTAESQWGGRGRLGRSWHSPAGRNLLFTAILKPGLPATAAQVHTLLGAVAAARAIKSMHQIPVALKWPNDLVVEGRKLGGILTELAGKPGRTRHVVVGAGLNVNSSPRDFPAALRATATSLRQVLGGPVRRVPLLRRILEEMDRRYVRLLADGDTERVIDEWRSLTPMIGRIVRISHLRHETEGTAMGVDSDGALLLRTSAGSTVRVLAGEVTYLRD